MCIFERAYKDFAGRFQGFVIFLKDRSTKIWNWFWSGPGAQVIDIVLRVLVVLSGVWMGYLYVNYEGSKPGHSGRHRNHLRVRADHRLRDSPALGL